MNKLHQYQIPYSCWQRIKRGVMIPSIHYLPIMVLDLLLPRKLLDQQWKKLMHFNISGAFFCKLSIHPQPFCLLVCFSFALSVCSYRSVKIFNAFSRQCVFAEHLRNSCLLQIHREHFLSPRVASTNSKEMFMMQIQMMFPNALYFQINPNK